MTENVMIARDDVQKKRKQITDYFFSETNMLHVKKSVQELRAGNGMMHELIETEDE